MKSMTISPHVLTLVRDYGHNKAVAWLEGNEELAIADDDLCSFLSRHDVEFDQLTESDRDTLRDLYLETIKLTFAKRLALPVSVPVEASFPTLTPELRRHLQRSAGTCVSDAELIAQMGPQFTGYNPSSAIYHSAPPSPEKPVVQPTGSDSAGLLEEAKIALQTAYHWMFARYKTGSPCDCDAMKTVQEAYFKLNA
jgi:hypothetical protein